MTEIDPAGFAPPGRWLDEAGAPYLVLRARHALASGTARAWVDAPARPTCLILIGRGVDQVELLGLGQPGPAVGWLAGRGMAGPHALLAPKAWLGPVMRAIGGASTSTIRTWTGPPDPSPPFGLTHPRVLEGRDEAAFRASAPEWAWATWRSFEQLIGQGLALALGSKDGRSFSALAWIHEMDGARDGLAAWVAPGLRRLGIGRDLSARLIGQVVGERRKRPVWTAAEGNAGSIRLALALGFSGEVAETLLRWPGSGLSRHTPSIQSPATR